MLSKSFKSAKCKLSLQLAISRIKVLKNEKAARLKQIRRELAELLKARNEQTALIRVEQLFMEEKMVAAYDIVRLYCDLIVTHMPIIESQKNCPTDLKEAIAGIIYASQRCADILELQDIRKHFRAKYGKEFITATLELRPECGVNVVIVEKLAIKVPDVETKIKILNAIAAEHNVTWDPAATGEQHFTPSKDFHNHASQNHASAINYWENEATRSPTGSRIILYRNMTIPNASVPMTSHIGSTATASETGWKNFRNSFGEDVNPSMHRHPGKVQFMDAASAAEAAAESAEIARMAAMAAAELSSHEAIKRQYSTGSCELPMYDHKWPGRSVDSMRKGAEVQALGKVEADSSCWRSRMYENQERDQIVQDHLLRIAASRYSDDGSVKNKTSRSSSHSTLTSIDDDIPTSNLQKTRGFSQSSFYEAEVINLDWQSESAKSNVFSGEGRFKKQTSSSLSSMSSLDNIIPTAHSQKPNEYRCFQRGFSAMESLDQAPVRVRHDKGEPGARSMLKHSTGFASFLSNLGSTTEPPFTDQNATSYANQVVEHLSTNTGQRHGNGVGGQPVSSDYHVPFFEKSDADCSSDLKLDGNNSRHEFSSKFQVTQQPPHLSSNNDPRSLHQEKSLGGYLPSDSPQAPTHFVEPQVPKVFQTRASKTSHEPAEFPFNKKKEAEDRRTNAWPNAPADLESVEVNACKYAVGESWKRYGPDDSFSNKESSRHTETRRMRKFMVPHQSKNFTPACHGGSDNIEEEVSFNLRITESGKSLFEQTVTPKTPSSQINDDESASFSFRTEMGFKGKSRNTRSNVFSDDSESDEARTKNNREAERNIAGESCEGYTSGLSNRNHPSPSYLISPTKLNNVDRRLVSSMVEEQQFSRTSSKELYAVDSSNELPLSSGITESEFSNDSSNQCGIKLDLRKLRGGLKHRGLSQPPYLKDCFGNISPSSVKQTTEETLNAFQEPAISFHSLQTSMDSEAQIHAVNNQKPHRAPQESSQTLKAHFHRGNDDNQRVQPHLVSGNGGYQGSGPCHGMSNTPSPSQRHCPSSFTGKLESPLHSDSGARSQHPQMNSANAESTPRPLAQTLFSETEENSKFSHFNASAENYFLKTHPHVKNSAQSGSSKPAPVSSAEKQPPRTAASNGSPTPGTFDGSTSTESSLKRPSHVHPRLPDYDALKAYMNTLRTNPHT